MSCTTVPEAVLSQGCWDLSQTRNLFFSTKKYKVNEPLESGSVINDLTEFDTWQDFLESGKMLMLRVTVAEDTSTGAIVAEVGGRQQKVSDGEARYSFAVETGCPYTQSLETFKAFSGGYLYYMNEGKAVGGLLSETSGEVEPIKLNTVAPVAPKAINNGVDINSIMLDVYFDAAQMFDMCVWQTKFRYTALEQRYIIDAGSVILGDEAAAAITVTDDRSDKIISIYSGDVGDGNVSATIDSVDVVGTYNVVGNVITINSPVASNEVVSVIIDGDAPFWNTDFYGVELTETISPA